MLPALAEVNNRWQIARALYPPGGIQPSIQHNGEPMQSAFCTMLTAGLAPALLSRIFDSKGNFLLPTSTENVDIFNIDIDTLDELLVARLRKIYAFIGRSLNHTFKHGFNDHSWKHVRGVTSDASLLLLSAGYGLDQIRRIHIAGYSHDIGNLFGRPVHEFISADMIDDILPEMKRDEQQRDIVQRAIVFHAPGTIEHAFKSHKLTASSERIKFLREYLPPEALALLIADISQVGRDRVTRKRGISKDALIEDDHLFVNALCNSEGIVTEIDGNNRISKVRWQIGFYPGVSQVEERIARFERVNTGRIEIPQLLHEMHQLYGIPHEAIWRSKFFQIYNEKIQLMSMAVFALFPGVDRFLITFIDREPSLEVQDHEKHTVAISRDNLDICFTSIRNKYLARDARS